MLFAKLLKAFLPTLITLPAKSSKEAGDAIAHKLVRSYARGNVNLQFGRYLTMDQLEARKQKLARHAF